MPLTEVQGRKVYYESHGEHPGVPLVLLSSMAGSCKGWLALQVPEFSARLRTLIFDHRGVGDSDGHTSFEEMGPDIRAAIDTFFENYPQLEEVVLWGLCDAASAIMMFAPGDPRVSGVVLLNPWVRSDRTLAQSYLSGYYLRRLAEPDFWRQLLSGNVQILKSLRELIRNLNVAKSSSTAADERSDGEAGQATGGAFQTRMMRGLHDFSGEALFILSGMDITANEFKIFVDDDRARRRTMRRKTVRVIDFPEADHTFSTSRWREQVATWTIDWIRSR